MIKPTVNTHSPFAKTAVVAVLALTLSACVGNKSPEALDPYGPGADSSFGSAPLGEVSPGSREHVSAAQLELRKSVTDTINFGTDSSTLDAASMGILDLQAEWLIANPVYKVVLEGHADERGTRSYNLALGAQRAEAAKDYLIGRGVPADRVETMSWGKEAPIETCSEERCWSANRRAVTMVR